MAPLKINIAGLALEIPTEPLTPAAFKPFGEVLENPHPDLAPGTAAAADAVASSALPFNAVAANQGSAIKYQHISRPLDLYAQAPSKTASAAVLNMFVCGSRTLSRTAPFQSPSGAAPACPAKPSFFAVKILERHPYTSQTFIPLRTPRASARFLVLVAPSLSEADGGLGHRDMPVPANVPLAHPWALPGAGLPDLRRLRAFVATPEQAVTYGAGTWHAPMVVLGEPGQAISFVVTQFANGVAAEDCQEVEFEAGEGEGVWVRIDTSEKGLWKKPTAKL
ncbi:hypothetical protein BROUX41_000253 [Berkeleyomyces rouxiae]|uniref:uncharacterized protein n=1 Tax=Berkeleyomyces rouxiae TaxID=2035830 RepID=UPI003B82362A